MAFETIPFDSKTTELTVNTSITSDLSNCTLLHNFNTINSITPDECKIKYGGSLLTEGDKINIWGTSDYNSSYVIQKTAVSGTDQYIRIDNLPYLIGSVCTPASACITKQTYRIKKCDTTNNKLYLNGECGFSNGDYIKIIDSQGNIIDFQISGYSVSSNTNSVLHWLENDMYGTDIHIHCMMSDTLQMEINGGDFYNNPGSNKSGLTSLSKYSISPGNGSILPAVSTYKSLRDGRVRTILNSFHTPETLMIKRLEFLFRKINHSIIPITSSIYELFGNDKEGLVERVSVELTKLKEDINCCDLKAEIEYFQNQLFDNGSNYMKLITNTNQASNLTSTVASFINDSGFLRVLNHMEGGHQFDLDTYRLNKYFACELTDFSQSAPDQAINPEAFKYYNSGSDPTHDYYGGFFVDEGGTIVDLIQKAKDLLDLLCNDPLDTSLTAAEKLWAIALVAWTPHHMYWNGIGGFGCAKPRLSNIQSLSLPDPPNSMNKVAGTLIDETENSVFNDRGFKFGETTHLTQAGRLLVKHCFSKGVIVDLKHFHPFARNQILNMAERGYDYNPVYNQYANPVIYNNTTALEGEIVNADNIAPLIEVSNEWVPNYISQNAIKHYNELIYSSAPSTYPTPNTHQVMLTHVSFCYLDKIDTVVPNILKDIAGNINEVPTNLRTLSKSDLEALELEFKTNILKEEDLKYNDNPLKHAEKYTLRNSLKPKKNDTLTSIKTNIINFINSEYTNSSQKLKLIDYLEYYLHQFLRECNYEDNLNLDNEEIARVINLGGVLGVISEDRVLRQNEHMFGYGKRMKKRRPPYNINMWPIYGEVNNSESISLQDPNSTKRLLNGIPFDFADINNTNIYCFVDMQHQIAFVNEDAIFPTIQDILNKIDKESRTDYANFNHYISSLDIKEKLYENGDSSTPINIKSQAIAGLESMYRAIDHIAKVARLNVCIGVNDKLYANDSYIDIKEKLKNYYKNISIASDFDGMTNPIDLFASPRMFPILVYYVANRIKWDLYRRFYGLDDLNVAFNNTISGKIYEKGQSVPFEEGLVLQLNYFINNSSSLNSILDGIVKDICIQIFDTNFINQVKGARNW